MFELLCKSAVIFATFLFIDMVFNVKVNNRVLLKFHSELGPLTFWTFCFDVMVKPLLSYILIIYIPYDVLLSISISTLYIPYIIAIWTGIISGYFPFGNNYIKAYHYIHAASIGYFCANMMTDDRCDCAMKIMIFVAMHDTMCGIYWFIICLQNGYYNTKDKVK
jgi:hypothetical protein